MNETFQQQYLSVQRIYFVAEIFFSFPSGRSFCAFLDSIFYFFFSRCCCTVCEVIYYLWVNHVFICVTAIRKISTHKQSSVRANAEYSKKKKKKKREGIGQTRLHSFNSWNGQRHINKFYENAKHSKWRINNFFHWFYAKLNAHKWLWRQISRKHKKKLWINGLITRTPARTSNAVLFAR